MKISIPKENHSDEARVAGSPENVKKLINLGAEVTIQSGAGEKSSFPDEQYKEAGAKIAKSRAEIFKNTDIVLCVRAPSDADIKSMKKGALLIGTLNPYNNPDLFKSCTDNGVIAMSMELMPRITRAQSMDVLSSQANLAGYKSVLDACEYYTRVMPMMMTAAGTVPPAKVFVMGAGVAGLQAIATARRLGAVVSATDVRPAAKEQVESLGAKFVAVEDDEFRQAESEGGYAKEMSDDYKKKQAELIEQTVPKQDIIITTALIPGRPAPKLVTDNMVKSMKPGSVIVDMAVEQGGNVEPSKAGDVVTKHGVTIIGHKNIPGRLATDASNLYSKNLLNLVTLLVDDESKGLKIDWDDDIVKGIALTKAGKIIHPNFAEALKSSGTTKSSSGAKNKSKSKSSATKSNSGKKSSSGSKSSGKKSTSSSSSKKKTSSPKKKS